MKRKRDKRKIRICESYVLMKKLVSMKCRNIKKWERDRHDLVAIAIIKLKESINELNQKGREKTFRSISKK